MNALTPELQEDANIASIAEELKAKTTAVRLMKSKWGTSKSLTFDQKRVAASAFSAKGEAISATKKLVDTKDKRFRAVTSVINRASKYWAAMTTEFPEEGIRLLRMDRVNEWENGIKELQDELQEAVDKLEEAMHELKERAASDLADLFNPADYPSSVRHLFAIEYDYPSVEPDLRLKELHPEIYHREQARVRARFEEAVQLTEQALASELQKLLEHMVDRLSGLEDGKPKTFKDATVNNVIDFVDRFKKINLGSNQELENAVDQVKAICNGVSPKALRDNGGLKALISGEIAKVKDSLDNMMMDRGKRKFTFE